MPERLDYDRMRAHTRKLFQQRMLYVLHVATFIGVMVLTRFSFYRLSWLLAVWVVFLLAHTILLTVYEMRDRELVNRFKRESRLEKDKHDDEREDSDAYYTVGDDGELIRLSEDEKHDVGPLEGPRH